MTAKAKLLTGAMLAILMTTGCEKKPGGQIVAVVNGEEISIQELNAEFDGLTLPASVDRKEVMREILQRVIDRKLMVQRAQTEGLDKSPEFIAQQRRLNENLLVSLMGKQIAKDIATPEISQIEKYIADHPRQFSGRQRLILDQIQFEPPKNPATMAKLKNLHSLDAVSAALTADGVKHGRGKGAIDSSKLPDKTLAQIDALPAGEPFIMPSNGRVVASVVVSRQPIPPTPDAAREAAAEMLRRQALSQVSKSSLAEARQVAIIDYQPSFAPTPSTAPAKNK